MEDTSPPLSDRTSLRWLKVLVGVLTVTMIVGFVVIVVLFALRFKEFSSSAALQLPEFIDLPEGTRALSYTQGESWYLIVTDSQEILLFNRSSGELMQRVEIRHQGGNSF
ncbi:MAG: DUF6476 family protein [Rhodobacteraceae bacterium]|nr:DUF6476 family protein [Paracoccaceae bacterium]